MQRNRLWYGFFTIIISWYKYNDVDKNRDSNITSTMILSAGKIYIMRWSLIVTIPKFSQKNEFTYNLMN